ncbi:E3 ubiquitin-protein ligase ZNRF1 isoform X2 [Pelodiscus sinensis]|uniref:E3 ubiquitin-protein ligase ZNRF1 isoform X2 n=1 Tax=Pelodiscus sinensis TaxID=13735 RepID=UPI003F6BE477
MRAGGPYCLGWPQPRARRRETSLHGPGPLRPRVRRARGSALRVLAGPGLAARRAGGLCSLLPLPRGARPPPAPPPPPGSGCGCAAGGPAGGPCRRRGAVLIPSVPSPPPRVPARAAEPMGGKQSSAGRARDPFPGVSSDDSAVPPPGAPPPFGPYRAGGAMGLRSRSVSSVAGMDPAAAAAAGPFGLYARAAADPERAPAGGGSAADSTYAHGNGYQETGGGRHGDGMLYLGPRASLADALHIAPRWFSAHSGILLPFPPTCSSHAC